MPHSEHQPPGDLRSTCTLDDAQAILGTIDTVGAYNRLRSHNVHPVEHSPIRYVRVDVVRVAQSAPASLMRRQPRTRR